MPEIESTPLQGVFLLKPTVHRDGRGFFMESYRRSWLAEMGIFDDFVQHNRSLSKRHVLRGLHYQLGSPQAKLVQVTRGVVRDVVVDVRRGSPDFGRWYGTELSADEHRLMYIPRGFAHGYFVLSDEAEFFYMCSDYYSPSAEKGIGWNCRVLAIDWRIPPGVDPVLSDKDRSHPDLDRIRMEDLPVA